MQTSYNAIGFCMLQIVMISTYGQDGLLICDRSYHIPFSTWHLNLWCGTAEQLSSLVIRLKPFRIDRRTVYRI